MTNIDQCQTGGIGSHNTQIGTQNNIYGIEPQQALQMTMQLFRDNFPKLQDEARLIAEKRINDLCETLFEKLIKSNFINFDIFKDPDIQYVIFEAEKEYARYGDENLKELLCDILSERMNVKKDSILHFSLNEAIKIVPVLSNKHLDMLSLSYVLKLTRSEGINNIDVY